MKLFKKDRLDPSALVDDSLAHELAHSDDNAIRNSRVPVPSPNPATNLIIAEIVLRSLSILARKEVEKRIAKATYRDEERAEKVLRGRTILSTLALYGAGRLAITSPLGLGLVATTLVGKTLYDRGRDRQRRRLGL